MSKASRKFTKGFLSTTAIAGVAAALLATGVPAPITGAFADAVRVEAPQAPSFADVVDAVSPAVVSVRVQAEVKAVSNDSGFNFDFNGKGFDDLPDDHPMKKFFDQFNRGFSDKQGPDSDRRAERDRRGPDMKKRPGRVRPVSQGSGFFISEDGLLVTNNHVVEDGSAFTVIMDDGTELDAKLIGRDKRTDLAVLKVEEDRKFTYVDFADDSKIRVGDWVVAVGNPFGLGGTVTAGIVSARGRDIGAGPYDDFIQVDAAVNRGNSGGPTFNLNGEVIGINTAIFSPSGGNVGIAFAIPASTARAVIDDLIKDGSVERGWLGVQIQPVTADIAESLGLAAEEGALVTEPQKDAPAAKAGIVAGDVVTAVDGDTVKGPRELAKMIAAMEPGKSVEITVWRNGKSETVKVDLGSLPTDMAAVSPDEDTAPSLPQAEATLDNFGLTVVPAETGAGLVITSVAPDSVAEERGLRAGDVILAVNNKDVTNASDVVSIIDAAAKDGRKAALFQVENENRSRFVALPIEKG
ncbi:periplasmic serine protease, Do/DeqQ family [Hoeflea sp. IMCC20628]|uniref:Do family serine endopeptidase n=1 Tax=Hoeflea sp. IMCC20628 TaxID=1620421 RepID=UPI00063A913E|nr:Do family serine endopeptidase [Hoeflea sp. IMCC20628]AKI01196.1 periplasmic serine protease, Do/DeqQ family [Hoeflea sp. IMCC20628]